MAHLGQKTNHRSWLLAAIIRFSSMFSDRPRRNTRCTSSWLRAGTVRCWDLCTHEKSRLLLAGLLITDMREHLHLVCGRVVDLPATQQRNTDWRCCLWSCTYSGTSYYAGRVLRLTAVAHRAKAAPAAASTNNLLLLCSADIAQKVLCGTPFPLFLANDLESCVFSHICFGEGRRRSVCTPLSQYSPCRHFSEDHKQASVGRLVPELVFLIVGRSPRTKARSSMWSKSPPSHTRKVRGPCTGMCGRTGVHV